jgi:hypothetical protein
MKKYFILLMSFNWLISHAQQLEALAGYYQSAGNKEQYVQFFVREGQLVAKLLWNNAELHFMPESELIFNSRESEDAGPIHIVFHKDSSGAADQVDVAKIGVWKRVRDYKPIVRKEMPHTPEQLKPFEGLYQLQNQGGAFIQFTVRENRLILKQSWDGDEVFFLPESELKFYSPVIPAFVLDFTKEKDGSISRVLAFKHDVWIKVQKKDVPLAVLKTYEGKYRSKDDPDNQVELRAGNNSMIVKQLWDGKEIIVVPWTETYFYNDAQTYPLQIVNDKNGNLQGVYLLNTNFFERVPG